MQEETSYHYLKIKEAIAYLDKHFKEQPSLDRVAEAVHLSPFHFQRVFKEWVGVSPKKYLQYLSTQYTKAILKEQPGARLFDVADEAGFSGTSRLHDLFVTIEGMTPGEFKHGGEHLSITYQCKETLFGNVFVASTPKGICFLSFIENKRSGLEELKDQFPKAKYTEGESIHHNNALAIFNKDWTDLKEVKLHLKGSDFQLKVWEALLKIPSGSLHTYGQIASSIQKPKASRAVGTAIGNNPIAFLIPCHRVIQSSGHIGGYRWNPLRKKVMIGWELAKRER